MRRWSVVFLMVLSVFLFSSCIDYSVIEKEEAKQVMAQQKEEQAQKEIDDKISKLEKDNEEYRKTIEKITKQNESLKKDYDDIFSKYKTEKNQSKKCEGDLSFTLKLLENEMDFTDFLKDIIITDSIMNDKITFEFVDLLSVEYSEKNETEITYDVVKTDYLKKGYNPLKALEIEDDGYYDDENYDNVIVKEETVKVSKDAYININDVESFGFTEQSAKYLKQIVEVSKNEANSFSWYIEDKKYEADRDGNILKEKRIYFIGMIDDEVVIMMERGMK